MAVIENFTSLNMFTGMCLWEAVMDYTEEANTAAEPSEEAKQVVAVREAIGACEMRDRLAQLAPLIDNAWDKLSEDMRDSCGAFDWEIVPDVLGALARHHGSWLDASQKDVDFYMRGVATREYFADPNNGGPQS